ncbi:hypothetical protein MLD38_017546 [Melastoma candidum]|uniref:Uncharacterized protein n=1 Tax=Melastoma candidum TaxID=119954 RepID=A0ACB9QR22_9MYRT|nr:hypothetical protein MLD38_017546 [Melastoma candidum]
MHEQQQRHHILVMSCGAQGHINPSLELAKRLLRAGAGHVTFITSVSALDKIRSPVSLEGLSYATFSEGNPTGLTNFIEEMRRAGSESLHRLIDRMVDEGRHVTFLVYTVLLPWAADVARERGIPSAFLCIQSAATLAVYDWWFPSEDDVPPPGSIVLPGLPPLSIKDVPTFLLPDDQHHSIAPLFREHMAVIRRGGEDSTVLVNTFDALEGHLLKALVSLGKVIAIGPLVPSACTDEDGSAEKSLGCDLFDSDQSQYLPWLNSQAESSVVYVSFGSMIALNKTEIRSTFDGLVDSSKPFLWALRTPESPDEKEAFESVKHELDLNTGLIVPWCSQVEVLNHPSVGCFVTHCGWNSTLEGLAAGVPTVGCPHFSDQTLNAKMIEEVWKTGIRATSDENGIITRDETRRCIELVMVSEEGKEMRQKARRWRVWATEAVREGGSSDNNLRKFMDGIPSIK